ncbi:MAG: class I SAM-dependent methyltransferase [Candidatus Woesearchaeota archaeon]|jgi:ubiquinone/menaquinone biosynthesis C-methylase UbiE
MEEKDFYNHVRSGNPIIKYLVKTYFSNLNQLILETNAKTVLDIGCGQGEITNYISTLNGYDVTGIDISAEKINFCSKTYNFKAITGNGYSLPFENNSFDLVIATEVLEHQEHPHLFLDEAKRVMKKQSIFSVPNEPYFRLGNFIRGKYISDFGNSPGHLQNWTSSQFEKLLKQHFSSVHLKKGNVWNIALCEK